MRYTADIHCQEMSQNQGLDQNWSAVKSNWPVAQTDHRQLHHRQAALNETPALQQKGPQYLMRHGWAVAGFALLKACSALAWSPLGCCTGPLGMSVMDHTQQHCQLQCSLEKLITLPQHKMQWVSKHLPFNKFVMFLKSTLNTIASLRLTSGGFLPVTTLLSVYSNLYHLIPSKEPITPCS